MDEEILKFTSFKTEQSREVLHASKRAMWQYSEKTFVFTYFLSKLFGILITFVTFYNFQKNCISFMEAV